MELRVNEVQLPEKIEFNYEELKQELEQKVKYYSTLVYTDEQIGDAKADRSDLNKLKKALNDERIRREREYMQPFHEFKMRINEIIEIIDRPVTLIDGQIKEYEKMKKQEKKEVVQELFKTMGFQSFVTLDMIFQEKWLNASYSIKKIKEEMQTRLFSIGTDIATLSNLPEFCFEATEVYKTTLDLNRALNEGKRLSEIAKAKAEHEAELARRREETECKQENQNTCGDCQGESCTSAPPVRSVHPEAARPVLEPISFKAWLTTEDALALREFFISRHIEFEAI